MLGPPGRSFWASVPAKGSSDSRRTTDCTQHRVWVQQRQSPSALEAVACPAVRGGSLWLTRAGDGPLPLRLDSLLLDPPCAACQSVVRLESGAARGAEPKLPGGPSIHTPHCGDGRESAPSHRAACDYSDARGVRGRNATTLARSPNTPGARRPTWQSETHSGRGKTGLSERQARSRDRKRLGGGCCTCFTQAVVSILSWPPRMD